MKKVGIIGSGIVAKTLAAGFLKYDYDIMMGTRNPEKLEDWNSKEGNGAQISNFKNAAEFGELLVLAVKGSAAESMIKDLRNEIKGKTIIDTTNPIEDVPPVNGVLKFFTNLDASLMENLKYIAPEAHFVKAFNSVGSALMVNPELSLKPSMFIAGDNENAKEEVKTILDQFGWESVDMGKAEAARAIEPLCILWCIPGFIDNQWTHAFKLLKK
ncbi:NAD(P)-binding domain-containing protein [Hyphobacterium sp. CCMP332]|nr:NAD(P)-binding domain-containing protein [Hyphobacterium sp. CCMP332]